MVGVIWKYVTTEIRGRFESGSGHFEVFRKKMSHDVPRESVSQTQGRPKSKMVDEILRRFHSDSIIMCLLPTYGDDVFMLHIYQPEYQDLVAAKPVLV